MLIASSGDAEALYSATAEVKGTVYGGGRFVPGHNFGDVIAAAGQGTYLGAMGLWLSEESVTRLSGDLRFTIGRLLSLLGPVYLADDLSVQWAAHFGWEGKLGGHPVWLGRGVSCQVGGIFTDAGLAPHAAALMDRPFVLLAEHSLGWEYNLAYHSCVRWAQQYEATHLLAYSKAEAEELLAKWTRGVDPRVIEEAKRRARRTLDELAARQAPRHAASALEALEQSLGERKANMPRELKLGAVFDPATHYTKEYFGGEAGLVYTDPQGQKKLYHGPAMDWGGFDHVAKMLRVVLPVGKDARHVDLGCGAGNVVRRMQAQGWRSHGLDISSDAIAAAHPDVREKLVCADVTKLPPEESGAYDVVTAFDFLEHIYLRDVEAMVRGIKGLLKPKGLGVFIICTRGDGEQDWTIEPGATFTTANSWLLASGHVTIRRWAWWAKTFVEQGFRLRSDLAYLFQVLRDEDPVMHSADSWRCRNLLIVETP